jgi:hypothetical protein
LLKIAIAKGVLEMFYKKNAGIVNAMPAVYFSKKV